MHRSFRFAVLALAPSAALALDGAVVARSSAGLTVTWNAAGPVDVYVAERADATVGSARLVSRRDTDGRYQIDGADTARRYFILRDAKGAIVRVAERELPLERGSNFRDIGGYAVAGGRTIRWGRIFRSGALPMLTEADYKQLEALKISSIVDLRSNEERDIAPTQLDDRTGALFVSNDYSIKPLMRDFAANAQTSKPMYAGMEQMLKPQLRAVFNRLLAAEGATMYHCSAGQDRTGVTTALIMSALGVDRDVILKDYHLSTALRRPANEMPMLDPKDHPGNPILAYYVEASKKPGGAKAEPLYARDGTSLLVQFFQYLDTTYGGVKPYLARELGVGPAQIALLRARYTE